jgi:uncharacterized membrane protein YoaK (UPF0700 family)
VPRTLDGAAPRLALRHSNRAAVLLTMTLTTGIVDAVSGLNLGGVLTAKMTGNVIFLSSALAGYQHGPVAPHAAALGAFVGGAVWAGWIVRRCPGTAACRTVLRIEALLIALCAAVAVVAEPPPPTLMIVILATAMGTQIAVARFLAVTDLNTTALTLTIAGVATGFETGSGRRRALSAIAAMAAGAFLGTLLLTISLLVTLAVAATLCLSSSAAIHRAASTSSAPSPHAPPALATADSPAHLATRPRRPPMPPGSSRAFWPPRPPARLRVRPGRAHMLTVC